MGTVCHKLERLRQDKNVNLTRILKSKTQFTQGCLYPKSGVKFDFTPSPDMLKAMVTKWTTLSRIDLSQTDVCHHQK
jgi:hypothetical protein